SAFTFIALCELPLHAPLLPQHAGLRQGRIDPRELFPPLRFELLLGATQNVKPLQGLAEAPRYYVELCKALGWVHPVQMSKVALDGPQIVADRRAHGYIWAQTERAGMQDGFTHLLRRTLHQGGAGERIRWQAASPGRWSRGSCVPLGAVDVRRQIRCIVGAPKIS